MTVHVQYTCRCVTTGVLFCCGLVNFGCLVLQPGHLIMLDMAHVSRGTRVTVCTASDCEHQPEAMIDGSDHSFFVTTGLYPQELVFSFAGLTSLNSLALSSYNIRHLSIESSENADPVDFAPLLERDLKHVRGQIQVWKSLIMKLKDLFCSYVVSAG